MNAIVKSFRLRLLTRIWASAGMALVMGTGGLAPAAATEKNAVVALRKQAPRMQQTSSAPATVGPTMTLISEPTPERIAELHWRIALPVAALILSLMAIPLSFVNPRSGTSGNLILAILIFFLYYNLLNFFQAWTADGTVPMWLGLLPVHLAMIAILVALFSRQLFSFRFLVSSRR